MTVSMMFRQQLDQLVEDLNRLLASGCCFCRLICSPFSALQEPTRATSDASSPMGTSRQRGIYFGERVQAIATAPVRHMRWILSTCRDSFDVPACWSRFASDGHLALTCERALKLVQCLKVEHSRCD